VRVLFITLFIGLWSGIPFAVAKDFKDIQERLNNADPEKDPESFVRVLYDAYKETERIRGRTTNDPEYANYLKEVNREKIEEGTICVDCPNTFLLTEQVNDILQHLAKDPKSKIPPSVLNEVNSLDGMFYFTKEEARHSIKTAEEIPCRRWELGRGSMPFQDPEEFDASENILVFSRNINFKNISQAQLLEPGVQKTYFLRGQYPHEDIVIRVIRDSKGNAQVAYFRNKEIYLKAKKVNDQRLRELEAMAPEKRKRLLREQKLAKEAAEKKAASDHLDIDYGWKTEGDGLLPKKVTILSLDGASHFDTVSIQGEAEISSKKQAAGIKVKSKEGKDYVGLELEADGDLSLSSRTDFESFAVTGQVKKHGNTSSASVQFRDDKDKEVVELSVDRAGLARLGVPMSFNVYETGLDINGKVVAGQDGSFGGNWSIVDGTTKRRYMDVGLHGNKKGESVSVGHSRNLSKNSSISIKVARDNYEDNKQTAGWVQFKYDF
tara:strand:- start:117106 stop:118584 length:1479 start_codon:yes stop_codon:yes gene_type:complete